MFQPTIAGAVATPEAARRTRQAVPLRVPTKTPAASRARPVATTAAAASGPKVIAVCPVVAGTVPMRCDGDPGVTIRSERERASTKLTHGRPCASKARPTLLALAPLTDWR